VKIAISGIGGISAAGRDVAQTLDAFRSGARNPGPVSSFSTILPYPVFEVEDTPTDWNKDGLRTLHLALSATTEAWKDARLPEDVSSLRVGVSLGTTIASQLNDIDFYRSYRSAGNTNLDSVDRYLKGNLAEAVARRFNLRGPASTVCNACSSGADAIGMALSWLRNGICDIAVAGGSDEINRVPLCGFGALKILSESPCRPFDRDRAGLNLGEGAGILILETEETLLRRGMQPSLYLAGYGSASDAYHLTAPHPEGAGLESALRTALAQANISPEDVSFVNAHGTATRDNDLVEGSVFARVFGPHVKFLSTKGFTGHTLGAAGGLEAVFTAAAFRSGWIPASSGFAHADEDIPVSPITEKTPIGGPFAVSTSLAFGGSNAAIVVAFDENNGPRRSQV
jgi:3-oxoacyl-(acyl-carrier-protein) synthase